MVPLMTPCVNRAEGARLEALRYRAPEVREFVEKIGVSA